MNIASYEEDVIAWSWRQVALLRSGRYSEPDIEHLAQEIESVANQERRDLGERVSALMADLLRWQEMPDCRCLSWMQSIRLQRRSIRSRIRRSPSINSSFADPDWLAIVWSDAVVKTIERGGTGDHPEVAPWTVEEVISDDFFPG